MWHRKPPALMARGEFSIAVLLICYMVNGKVFSEIGD